MRKGPNEHLLLFLGSEVEVSDSEDYSAAQLVASIQISQLEILHFTTAYCLQISNTLKEVATVATNGSSQMQNHQIKDVGPKFDLAKAHCCHTG